MKQFFQETLYYIMFALFSPYMLLRAVIVSALSSFNGS